MAISGLIGLPRHGKSYSAIELFLLSASKLGRTIVTNIPLQPKFYEDFPDVEVIFIDLELYKDHQKNIWDELPPALYLLDELWKIWPAGLKASAIPDFQLRFIKEHGHKLDSEGRETDIILVTQCLDDIALPVRNMVETTILCTKLSDLGQMNKFRRDYYRGVIKGFSGKKSNFIKSEFKKYDKSIYQYYKSHTLSNDVDTVDGSGVVGATIFGSLGFKFGLGFLIFLIVAIYFGYQSVSNDVKKMTESKNLNDDFLNKSVPESGFVSEKSITVPSDLFNDVSDFTHVIDKTIPEIFDITSTFEESKNLRVVGYSFYKKKLNIVFISDGIKTRRISPDFCQLVYEIVCVYRNEIVAKYTGRGDETDGFVTDSFKDSSEVKRLEKSKNIDT